MTDKAQLKDSEVLERVRGAVRALIDDGVDAPTISYSLAFIATELGLCIASDPVKVFPVVLHGVIRAASENAANEKAAEREPDNVVPANATLH